MKLIAILLIVITIVLVVGCTSNKQVGTTTGTGADSSANPLSDVSNVSNPVLNDSGLVDNQALQDW